MPKSKTRGSLKEHRKRVIHRNNRIKGEKRKMEELYNNMMSEAYEKFLAENPSITSGITQTEVVDVESANINDINVDYTPITPEDVIEQ
jgi:hypothetical protein